MNSFITQSKQMPAIGLAVALLVLGLLTACEPSKEKKAQLAEEKRVACLDKICEGDVEPPHDLIKEAALKLNGQWFIGPREYFNSVNSSAVFYWPKKNSEMGLPDALPYLEQKQPYYDKAIEIFFRSNNFPQEPRGYHLIELAEKNNWIDSRKNIRSGLDAITMKHVIGPRGQYIDHVTYYVATQFKGLDGLPPVATCNHDHPANGGGTGFMWQPGIWLGTRMNQKHCADWPEIYQEITRVLTLLKKVLPLRSGLLVPLNSAI